MSGETGPARIVASMTTIPSRISLIRPVLESALTQTVPISHVEINVPHFCVRTGEPYVLPDWLEAMDRVKIFRTEDYGAITKIGPTLLRYKDDRETSIWSIDDDCAYPPNQLSLLLECFNPARPQILTRYGGELKPDGTVQFWVGNSDVTMFEGFGGVLYPPACIDDQFLDYLTVTAANEDCRRMDDLVLAMYFTSIGLPIRLHNVPSDETPYMVTGWLPHASVDALGLGGHEEKYKRIFRFINALRQGSGAGVTLRA